MEDPTTTTTSGSAPATTSTPPPAAPASAPQTGTSPISGFKEYIEKHPEFSKEPALRQLTDFDSFAKSYIHSQKMIGQDKIPVPSKFATKQDWDTVFSKLGRPESADKYELKAPDGVVFDESAIKEFKGLAHELNLLPHQAQGLAEFDAKRRAAEDKMKNAERAAASEEAWNFIKEEWGDAFDRNVGLVREVMKESASADDVKYLNDSGLGNNPWLVNFIYTKFVPLMKEDKFGGKSTGGGVMTPAEAKREFDKVLHSDMSHPYYNRKHPGHAAAQEEMERLSQLAHPEKNKN